MVSDKLTPIKSENIEVCGTIVSIKDKLVRIELDTQSLIRVLDLSTNVNKTFFKETGNNLESINIFNAGILRFRTKNKPVFELGSNTSIAIRPESVYKGTKFSLNWVHDTCF